MTEKEAIEKMKRENPEFMSRILELAKAGQIPMLESIPLDAEMVMVGGQWPCEITGSKQARCERCRCFISIAPSSQELLKLRTGRTFLHCISCAINKAVLENEIPKGPTQ